MAAGESQIQTRQENAAGILGDATVPHFTAAQLHRLSRHIRTLSELTRQLKARRDGSFHVAAGALQTSVQPKQLKRPRGRPGRKPRAQATPKPKAGPRKRRRQEVVEELEGHSEDSDASGYELEAEEPRFDSDVEDTDVSQAEEATPEPGAEPQQKRSKPRRTSARQTPKARRKAKQKDSDNDDEDSDGPEVMEEAVARAAAATEPAQLASLRPVPYTPRDQEHCDVCGSAEGWDGNAILLCDGRGCSVALHQHCCGVADIPEGDWLCDGCAAGVPPREHHCLLCPVSGGALRRVAGVGPAKLPPGADLDQGAWVHLACGVWTPEVYFEQAAELQGLRLDSLSAERVELRCGICKQGGGSAVQCCFGKCIRPFHILCARRHGNAVIPRAADGLLLCFCEMHSKERFAKTRQQMIDEVPEGLEPALPGEAPPTEPNEYELQRERNIQRNKLRLAEIEKMLI